VTRRAVIVDTNVVVAGLLTRDESSPVARVLDGMLRAAFPFAVSESLLAEYCSVLGRSGLRKRHGLKVDEIDILLTDFAQHAIVVVPTPGPPAPDRGDQLLWDLLAARADLLLVTGDLRLQQDRGMKARVLSPRQFVDS
jgi:predicted nucleic acid-binding protein